VEFGIFFDELTENSEIAYVPQSAWILSGNIETNILFGSPMDCERYKSVLHACSLLKDVGIVFAWRSDRNRR
jgi:ABC-type transport system involved in cytochrome bd biosynthesis fused ATPase/permease subunit